MDNSLADTRPTFSRLTEGKTRQSWRAALPAVVVIVAFVALVGYLASKLSSYSQKAAVAERDAGQYRDQLTAMGKQVATLQGDLSVARSPGRTTVILQSAQEGKAAKKGSEANASRTWAAVTWGEQPDGKTWMRVGAYGLSQEGGKSYHLWMQPQTGDPVDVGALEVDQNGDGFAMKGDLPAIDQGKAVMLTTDADNAKQPGDTIARADLPKLQPTTAQKAPAEQNQAKSGSSSQQMHQGK